MKTPLLILGACLLLSASTGNAQSRFVTMTVGSDTLTNCFDVGTNETAKIAFGWGSTYGSAYGSVALVKDGQSFDLGRVNDIRYMPPVVTAGPAKVVLSAHGAESFLPAILTLEVVPASFPPDKTVIIPEGTGANIVLESSTNLINWTTSSPGLYTNKTGNMFFRIRADRILLPASP